MSNERTILLAILLSSAGCAPPAERAGAAASRIEGGSADMGDTGVVAVALLRADGDLAHTCSGTLVAPSLVLTARHCVAETARFVDCESSLFGDDDPADRVVVTTTASLWSSDATWQTASRVLTPPDERTVCGHDIALIELPSPIGADVATPIAPRLDVLPAPSDEYAAVGYGAVDGAGDDVGQRRRRGALHVTCVGTECASTHVQGDEWRGDTGACNGDSGGPALDGDGRVIGVTSRGPKGCASPIYGGLPAHAAWLRDAARQAAQTGSYEKPAWAQEVAEEAHAALRQDAPRTGAGACAMGRGDASRAGLLLVAAAVLAAGLRRRG